MSPARRRSRTGRAPGARATALALAGLLAGGGQTTQATQPAPGTKAAAAAKAAAKEAAAKVLAAAKEAAAKRRRPPRQRPATRSWSSREGAPCGQTTPRTRARTA